MTPLDPQTPTPVTPTPAIDAAAVLRSCYSVYSLMQTMGRVAWNLIWANPHGFTPQQVLTALGSNAGLVFALSTLNATTVVEAATICGKSGPALPGVPTGYTAVVNADGTVTVTQA
jgi:hypothetical protein